MQCMYDIPSGFFDRAHMERALSWDEDEVNLYDCSFGCSAADVANEEEYNTLYLCAFSYSKADFD